MSEKQAEANAAELATVIGANCRVSGDVIVEGDVLILGTVEGRLESNGRVEIGPQGNVQGPVSGTDIRVDGSIRGDLSSSGATIIAGSVEGAVTCAGSIELTSESSLVGDVVAISMMVRDGASYDGRITIGARAAAALEGRERSNNGMAAESAKVQDESTREPHEPRTNQQAIAGLLRRRSPVGSNASA